MTITLTEAPRNRYIPSSPSGAKGSGCASASRKSAARASRYTFDYADELRAGDQLFEAP